MQAELCRSTQPVIQKEWNKVFLADLVNKCQCFRESLLSETHDVVSDDRRHRTSSECQCFVLYQCS